MPQTVTELLDAALTLPEADRVKLVELLASSLTTPQTVLHPAWAGELARRAAEIDAREVSPIPWEEVRQQIRKQVDLKADTNG